MFSILYEVKRVGTCFPYCMRLRGGYVFSLLYGIKRVGTCFPYCMRLRGGCVLFFTVWG